MSKKTIISILSVLIFIIVTGCNEGSQDPTTEQNNTIQVAVTSDSGANKLDATSYEGSMQLYTAVYDPLVKYGENGNIKPGLAESWEISKDGKEYVFHLRKDVKFSDGSDFNADALLFSIHRWKNKKEHAWLKTAEALKKVKKIDNYTVKMFFSEPNALILNELTTARPFRIMSPNSVKPAGDPNGEFKEAIGTGPWRIVSYEKDNETVLTPNQYYWKGKLNDKKMVWKVIPNAQTRSLALQEGSIQIAGGEMGKISYQDLKMFRNNDKYKVESERGTTSYFLAINNQKKSLQDVKVRQALNYAINKENLANQVLDDNGSPATGLFAKTVPFVTKENSPGYAYNLNKAKKLLEEAGYGAKGKELKLNLVFQTEEFPEWKEISEIIQNNLHEVGIEVELNNMESTSYYHSLWEKQDYDLLLYRTYADGLNPQGFLNSLFAINGDGKGIAYTDEHLSEYITTAGKAITNEERQEAYDKIFSYMHNNAVTVPLFYPDNIFVHQSDVKGFTWGPIVDNPVIWNNLEKEE
ncbi:ABC transporter substrate-binding protein [Virgibacillus chiguensis]|uniref:Peptide/nickel transport system substrate-binding protein n=1 Tax=Virgibacillus chiguensis TaxID=411959 RepID=A0A1M5MF15_9BACI|nr:ABC transporter substrate-binding protein [Virgibacillus chiguensis]SHG75747.1 peptide/nickel transport system substrate-binding protein [Virgibacillus chiguensis]